MSAIAVTGVAGAIGSRLVRVLDGDPDVERIVGLDVADPERRVRSLEFHRVDITQAELKPLLEGVDVVVHLAGVADPNPDEALVARIDLDGTRRVLDAAAAVGASRVVRLSTAAVYGAWPDNPVPLTEDAPLRPSAGFVPALHAVEVERLLAEWRREHPGSETAVLRSAPVVGRGIDSLAVRLLQGRPPVRVRGATPLVQVAHVDDVVAALALATRGAVTGVANVACDGWLAWDDVTALLPWSRVPGLPPVLVERMLALAWGTGVGDAPPALLPYLVHPWVVANDRLRAAGWKPTHSNEEAILETVESRPPLPVLPLAAAAVTTGVVVGAAWLTWRHRRRARRVRSR